ncbi:uncharacterized protein HRG_11495 [Hirsutella rhossiliensis]|uniref:AA1-like domain-containing protein n=1 Tax=Hirsutella rhossiliensis TaxID=111463 RepID=A0A9P8SC79_9HYPO|nr:uncharacterized protein HRG_11495 [Hirsutella rhossiliensis]KAH0957348.1 hypothetical protein HRG_11495 [Hirsutella rhossiliensis]
MQLAALILASLPGIAVAATAYLPPPALLAKVRDPASKCILPGDYHVRDFAGISNDTEATLSSYNFTYLSASTQVSTSCHFNASSVSTTPDWLTPRFSCQNRDVKFIWQDEKKSLLMIQRACPDTKGIPAYEVSGSVVVLLSCQGKAGRCVANQTDLASNFTSISPVLDPTIAQRGLG